MSIRITIQAPGLNLSAQVKDSALPGLIRLVQEARDDSAAAMGPEFESPRIPQASTAAEKTFLAGIQDSTKQHLKSLGAAELLNLLKKVGQLP